MPTAPRVVGMVVAALAKRGAPAASIGAKPPLMGYPEAGGRLDTPKNRRGVECYAIMHSGSEIGLPGRISIGFYLGNTLILILLDTDHEASR